MPRDPIVDEVRRVREDEAAKYGFDVKAILVASKRRQRRDHLCQKGAPDRTIPELFSTSTRVAKQIGPRTAYALIDRSTASRHSGDDTAESSRVFPGTFRDRRLSGSIRIVGRRGDSGFSIRSVHKRAVTEEATYVYLCLHRPS